MKDYICPSCKELQTSAIQWQSASIGYRFQLADREFDKFDTEDIVAGEHENWACPNCGDPLPDHLSDQLFNIMVEGKPKNEK